MRINSELMIYTARCMTVMTAPTAFLTLMGWTTALRTTLTEESMAGPLAATGVCLALTLAAAGVAAAAYLGGTRLRALEDRLLQEWAGLAPTWGNARWTLDRSGRHSNLRVTVPDGPGREELRWQAPVRQETDGTVRIERPELQGHHRTRGWISVPTEDTRPYPHSAVRKARVRAAEAAATEMMGRNMVVFSPIVYSATIQERDNFRPPEGWYMFDLHFLAAAGGLTVLEVPGWKHSRGILIEMAFARARKLPVSRMEWPEIRKLLQLEQGTVETLEHWQEGFRADGERETPSMPGALEMDDLR